MFFGLIKEKTTFQYIGGNDGAQIFGANTTVSPKYIILTYQFKSLYKTDSQKTMLYKKYPQIQQILIK